MRKVCNIKSRKRFYFDDGDEEEKKRQQVTHQSEMPKINALSSSASQLFKSMHDDDLVTQVSTKYSQ